MLYHAKLYVDNNARGLEDAVAAEHRHIDQFHKDGRVKGAWLRADGGGAVFVADCDDHQHFNELVRSLPLFPYFRQIEVTPLLPHPMFPEFAQV